MDMALQGEVLIQFDQRNPAQTGPAQGNGGTMVPFFGGKSQHVAGKMKRQNLTTMVIQSATEEHRALADAENGIGRLSGLKQGFSRLKADITGNGPQMPQGGGRQTGA